MEGFGFTTKVPAARSEWETVIALRTRISAWMQGERLLLKERLTGHFYSTPASH